MAAIFFESKFLDKADTSFLKEKDDLIKTGEENKTKRDVPQGRQQPSEDNTKQANI